MLTLQHTQRVIVYIYAHALMPMCQLENTHFYTSQLSCAISIQPIRDNNIRCDLIGMVIFHAMHLFF